MKRQLLSRVGGACFSYLSHGEAALPAGHHLVPLVVQHVHEAVRLVLAHQLGDVGGERRVLREADPVTCRQRRTEVRLHKYLGVAGSAHIEQCCVLEAYGCIK